MTDLQKELFFLRDPFHNGFLGVSRNYFVCGSYFLLSVQHWRSVFLAFLRFRFERFNRIIGTTTQVVIKVRTFIIIHMASLIRYVDRNLLHTSSTTWVHSLNLSIYNYDTFGKRG